MSNTKNSYEKKRLVSVYLLLTTIFLLSLTVLLFLSPSYQNFPIIRKENSSKKEAVAHSKSTKNTENKPALSVASGVQKEAPRSSLSENQPEKKGEAPQPKSQPKKGVSEKERQIASQPIKKNQKEEKAQQEEKNRKKEASRSAEKSQLPKEIPPTVSKPVEATQPSQKNQKKIPLYLVLDDVGGDLVKLKKFLALPIPITYAIIPFLAHSTEAAKLVHAKGREVIIHQPMEPLHSQDPGEGALFTWMSKDAIFKQLSRSFENVPYAVGMNNHMGSKATSDVGVMSAVLDYLGTSGLFFLDSKTTVDVVGGSLAKGFHCPYVQRNAMFLDNERDRESIEKAIHSGLKTAKKGGHAVMIGHVMTTELADVLLEIYPEILDEGYAFYNLSQYFTDFDGED